jgi:hypothetical protein
MNSPMTKLGPVVYETNLVILIQMCTLTVGMDQLCAYIHV